MLLPYLESGPLYDRCNFNVGIIGDATTEVLNTDNVMQKIAGFRCPSDIDPPGTWYSKAWPGNNYLFSTGTTSDCATTSNNVGLFYR